MSLNLAEYEQACQMCSSPVYEVKEKGENFIQDFMKAEENSPALKHILENHQDPMVLFVTVELLTKTYLVDSGIGIIECMLPVSPRLFAQGPEQGRHYQTGQD